MDTLTTIAPDAEVQEMMLEFKEDNFFQSGRFQLTPQSIDTIQNILKSIEVNGMILIGVTIESSTDKQGLSVRTRNALSSTGYDTNNKGLSHARNDVVQSVLNNNGVDSTIINQNFLSEQGSGDIDGTARYVRVIFDVLSFPEDMPAPSDNIATTYSDTFEVIKAFTKPQKKFKFRIPSCRKHKVGKRKIKPTPYTCTIIH